MDIEIVGVIGDVHFGRKNNSRERHSDTMQFFEKFAIPFASQLAAKNSKSALVLTGDIFDSKQAIETFISNDCYDIVAKLASVIDTTIYIGNHDLLTRGEDMVYHSAKAFRWIPNIRLFESYGEHDGMGFLPFYKNKQDELDLIEACNTDLLFTHTEYSGFYYEGKMIDESPKSIKPEAVAKFKRVINGHIHGRQEKFNIINVGSPFQQKFGEYKNATSVSVYNRKTDTVKHIDNKISPKFKIFHFFDFVSKTVDKIDTEVNNNYCKIITPHELYEKIDVDKLLGSIKKSYKELEFEPTNSVKREDIPSSENEDAPVTGVDIRVKYEEYINNAIDINGIMVDAATKARLIEDFRTMFADAEQKVNANDMDFN